MLTNKTLDKISNTCSLSVKKPVAPLSIKPENYIVSFHLIAQKKPTLQFRLWQAWADGYAAADPSKPGPPNTI